MLRAKLIAVLTLLFPEKAGSEESGLKAGSGQLATPKRMSTTGRGSGPSSTKMKTANPPRHHLSHRKRIGVLKYTQRRERTSTSSLEVRKDSRLY